jgi:uncharacterized protein
MFMDEGIYVDLCLIEAGAILHDIGRSKSHEVDHAAIGGKILRSMGVSEEVARIVDRHVGAGIPDNEAQVIGLPPGVYVPDTWEEKIVCYADKLVFGKDVEDINKQVEEFKSRHGEGHPGVDRLLELDREITEIIGKLV